MRTRPKSGFYSVPAIKYLLRSLAHVLFLLLYAQVLTHLLTVDQLAAIAPHLPPLTTAELMLIVWSITLGYEHRLREVRMRSFGLSTNLPLKSLVNYAHTILGVAIGLRLLTLVPGLESQAVYTAYQTLVSFDAILMCCELLTFMWTSINFGVLAITLVQMMIDLSLFLVFFSVILLGFCLALIGLSETAEHDHLLDPPDAAAAASNGRAGRLLSYAPIGGFSHSHGAAAAGADGLARPATLALVYQVRSPPRAPRDLPPSPSFSDRR